MTTDSLPFSSTRPLERQSVVRKLAESLLFLVPLAVAACCVTLLAPAARGATWLLSWSWVPSLDVRLSFFVDGLSLLFALVISGIGVAVFAYAPGYFGNDANRGRLYGWLVLFMAAMLGLVLSDNIISLFVFWELTSITSYMLIGYKHESEKARAAALQALLVTGLGGLALLAGLLLLGYAGGSYELTTLLTQGEVVRNHPLLLPIVGLILLGAFTKSAQFPFHFWLPAAMQAPTPVSAYLHSATMVKAGVYLVARLSPLFAGVLAWDYALLIAGTLTALTGGWLSLQQTDLKRILAYSTVSALGVLMLLIALGSVYALKAAIVFLLCHSLYKGALFLVAGAVDHSQGTRDIRQLGGLAGMMPFVALAAILAAGSKAGLPPAGGFLAKELIYESTLDLSAGWLPVLVAVVLVNISFVAVGGLVAVKPFFGQKTVKVESTHSLTWRLVFPPLLLGALGLAIGLLPAFSGTYVVGPAVAAVSGGAKVIQLKLWHGFNLPLALSVLTLLGGGLVYQNAGRLRWSAERLAGLSLYGPSAGYEWSLLALKRTAAWQTRVLQNGRLRVYLLVVLVSFSAVVGWELVDHIEIPRGGPWLEIQPYELFIPLLILCAAVMAICSSSRIAAVCALGVIGYAVAMLFVMFGAPDLAMTQLAIETLTVILFVFVIYRLPRYATLSSRLVRVRDAVVALLAGGVMTSVVLASTFAHVPSRVTQFFADNSLEIAKGRNLVNVILVDFRGLDTLAEITVLAVSALGIFALMNLRMNETESDRDSRTREPRRDKSAATDAESQNVSRQPQGAEDETEVTLCRR
jgi:multicomponent Na+:H+ antiporter subunit A